MRRLAVCLLFPVIFCVALAQSGPVAAIQQSRLQGNLADALSTGGMLLDTSDRAFAFELHLEMARIHDRIGLHQNSRPVAAALQHIELAAAAAKELDAQALARVELAFAEYYYRAEMSKRVFETATRHAVKARSMFESLDDWHGQADAVHRLGLIKLQQRELPAAHKLFDESLRLDRLAGERALLRADYERHVAYVLWLEDEVASALPYFERSLAVRIQAGAVDASMFAAISVASALVELERSEEARPHIDYALRIAEDIGSDAGRSRAEGILARIE